MNLLKKLPPTQEKTAPASSKLTEVGRIPADWDVCRLDELVEDDANIRYGVVQVGPHCTNGVPIVAIKYVKDISTAPLHRASPERERKYVRSRIQGSDVLISIKGTIGRVGVVPKGFSGNIARELARIRPRDKDSAQFLAYQLESAFTQQRINNAVVGTTRLEFSIAELKKFEIAWPPNEKERQEVVSALSSIDALISSLEALIAKKRDLEKAAMQQLLTGKRRLPGFKGKWEEKKLGNIANIKTGKKNNQDKVADGQYPFFVRSDEIERINTFSYDCEAILVPGEGNIGSIFHYINGKFDVHQRVYAITEFLPDVSGRYIHLWMKLNFGAHAMQNSVKATVDSLRLPTFQNFTLVLPPTHEEQTAIGIVLSDMDSELAALEDEREKAVAIKQGMMQELLTGRIRLL